MPPQRERTVATTIRLPESVYFELRALCVDPTIVSGQRGRAITSATGVKYDTWGRLFTALARRYLEEQKVARIADSEDTTE